MALKKNARASSRSAKPKQPASPKFSKSLSTVAGGTVEIWKSLDGLRTPDGIKLPRKKILTATLLVLKRESYTAELISMVFCSDRFIKKINREQLGHDYATDTLSYRFNEGKRIEGEFYISVETVAKNARFYRVSIERELLRVVIHSLLHLIGYADESPSEKKIMTAKEDFYLDKLFA